MDYKQIQLKPKQQNASKQALYENRPVRGTMINPVAFGSCTLQGAGMCKRSYSGLKDWPRSHDTWSMALAGVPPLRGIWRFALELYPTIFFCESRHIASLMFLKMCFLSLHRHGYNSWHIQPIASTKIAEGKTAVPVLCVRLHCNLRRQLEAPPEKTYRRAPLSLCTLQPELCKEGPSDVSCAHPHRREVLPLPPVSQDLHA